MLSHLYIENIAVIEKTQVDFSKGFNVFTGETGAGKSILIDAINAILGVRTSKDLVRSGTEKAFVSAVFNEISPSVIDQLTSFGYECEDDTLLISREITSDGKNSCKINGKPTTATILKELGILLINIHGQHDNQSLLIPEKHLQFIDNYGKLEPFCNQYRNYYKEYQQVLKEMNDLTTDDAEKERKMDLLRYQIDEIDAADLYSGEEEELSAKKSRHRNSESILQNLNEAHQFLSGDDEIGNGCVSALTGASKSLEQTAKYFENFHDISTKLEEMSYEIQEYLEQIRQTIESLDFDLSEIDIIESRLDLIYRLKRKYGNDIAEILQFADRAKRELQTIEKSEERIEELRLLSKEHYSKMVIAAEKLSEERKRTSSDFEKKVKEELLFLDMPFIEFNAEYKTTEPGPNGIDSMEFMISTNPGEPPKPLSRIASGGELARIMLSIKNVLSDKDNMSTMIFDEIDSGISGRAAQKVGQKLREVSNGKQVICVTHLAQIAALADFHLLIEKNIENGRTSTKVIPLNFEQRQKELARIIGGTNITQATLQAAREMLES